MNQTNKAALIIGNDIVDSGGLTRAGRPAVGRRDNPTKRASCHDVRVIQNTSRGGCRHHHRYWKSGRSLEVVVGLHGREPRFSSWSPH